MDPRSEQRTSAFASPSIVSSWIVTPPDWMMKPWPAVPPYVVSSLESSKDGAMTTKRDYSNAKLAALTAAAAAAIMSICDAA